MDTLFPIHPGVFLKEDFLVPMGLSAYRLSKDSGIPQSRISNIILGKRSITAETALKLSAYFGTSARMWLNMQMDYDLRLAAMKNGIDLKTLPEFQIPVEESPRNKKKSVKVE